MYLQTLKIQLKGGQTLLINFDVEDPGRLDPQINSFYSALADPTPKSPVFLFQGATMILVRLSEVGACQARTEGETETQTAPEGK